MASNDIDLLTYARRARAVGWSSIPVNQDKQADIPKVVPFRDVLPSDLELEGFFGINKKPTTVALAVLVDSNKVMIDTDCDGERIFITKVMPRLKPELKEKIKRTTHTKSPRGSHFLGKTQGGNDKIAKKEHTWKFVDSDGKAHDEIKIRLYGFYSIECGKGYDEVIAIEKSEIFIIEEIDEIIRVTDDVAKQCSAIKTITDKIKPYYINGNRDEINFSLSGFLHKGYVPEQLILDIVDPLIDTTSSVEPGKTIDVIQRTCKKPRDSDQVSGYKRFLAAVSNNHEVVTEIQQVLFNISGGKYFSEAWSDTCDAAAGFGGGNGNGHSNYKETRAEKKARKAKETQQKVTILAV